MRYENNTNQLNDLQFYFNTLEENARELDSIIKDLNNLLEEYPTNSGQEILDHFKVRESQKTA
jgi:hypothetical protein